MDHIVAKDRKYVVKNPGRGFSPARNHAIIEDVIQSYEAETKRRDDLWKEKISDRVDMAVSYLKRRAGGLETRIEDYLGPSNLKKAWGEAFTEKLKVASAIYREKGIKTKILSKV